MDDEASCAVYGQVVLTGQEAVEAASAYPPMIVGSCFDSSEILAGVYHDLRIAEGARSALLPGDTRPRTIHHGWCVRQDGVVIDSVFAQEIEQDQDLDLAAVQVTYTERVVTEAHHSRPKGQLRDEIRRRANLERPPLRTKRLRQKFAEQQRDAWCEAVRQTGPVRGA